MNPIRDEWRSEDGSVRLILGDCLEVLPTLEAADVDVIVTDPDYGTGGWRREAAGAGRNPSAKLVREEWDEGAFRWIDGRWPVVAFGMAGTAVRMLTAATAAGLTKHRCLYWRKPDPKPMPQGRTTWSVEQVWAMGRDGFQLYGGDDWFQASAIRMNRDEEAVGHPYQKPLAVVSWLLAKLTAWPVVCDPYLGSGTTAVACVRGRRPCVGIEIDADHWNRAVRRVRAELERFPLFEAVAKPRQLELLDAGDVSVRG